MAHLRLSQTHTRLLWTHGYIASSETCAAQKDLQTSVWNDGRRVDLASGGGHAPL